MFCYTHSYSSLNPLVYRTPLVEIPFSFGTTISMRMQLVRPETIGAIAAAAMRLEVQRLRYRLTTKDWSSIISWSIESHSCCPRIALRVASIAAWWLSWRRIWLTLLKSGQIQMIVASSWIDWPHREEFKRVRERGNIMQSFYRCPFMGHFRGLYTAHKLKKFSK